MGFDATFFYETFPQVRARFQSLHPRSPDLMLRIVGELGLRPEAMCVDVGCGDGAQAFGLASLYGLRVLGRIENVLADDAVLDESGRVDPARLNAFAFDQFQSGYYAMGEKVGQAWESGKRLA